MKTVYIAGPYTKGDPLLRLPGESSGADAEVEYAKAHNIPVFYNKADLIEWRNNVQ
jgi:hypothetical protein